MGAMFKWGVCKFGLGIGIGAIATLSISCNNDITHSSKVSAIDFLDDQGDFNLVYEEPDTEDHADVYELLIETAFYDDLTESLNNSFALPQDLTIIFSSCDEANAWYDPEIPEIMLCYDLVQHYANIASADDQSDDATEVIYAGLFTTYHELGHALIDQYQLPITGQEEDAADEFAAILLIDNDDYDAVIAGIDQFDLDAVEEAESGEEIPFWDEHSLSDQRFYNLACLVYGSDPEEFEDWVTDDFLPAERAELCEEDYEQARTSWEILLAPYRL